MYKSIISVKRDQAYFAVVGEKLGKQRNIARATRPSRVAGCCLLMKVIQRNRPETCEFLSRRLARKNNPAPPCLHSIGKRLPVYVDA